MNLTNLGTSSYDILVILLSFVCLAGVCGIVYFYLKKKGKIKQSDKKKPLLHQIQVYILKKRGDTLELEKTKGTLKPIEKDSEGKALIIDKKRRIDNFDFTKLNSHGQLCLIEKGDGQLAYTDLDKDKITSTGEGLLRDGFYLNQSFIDTTFPLKEDKWKVWLPVIVIAFALISVVVSLGLTYKFNTSNYEEQRLQQETYVKALEGAIDSLEKITRTIEISVETQEKISDHYKQIVGELKNIQSG